MKNLLVLVAFAVIVLAPASCRSAEPIVNPSPNSDSHRSADMDLGNFSVSLSVKDLAASRAFYEKLGFAEIGGDASQNWLILQNGHATIGLFQGMFEGNILTFNPGWDRKAGNVDPFTDVREIQRMLRERGIMLMSQADESTTGPASIMLSDPDGNTILLDQHR